MLDIIQSFSKLSKEQKEAGFLCSVFMMTKVRIMEEKKGWQFDFYNKEKKRITSYLVEDEVKLVEQEAEVFESENEIKEINLDELDISFEEAVKVAKDIVQDRHEGGEDIIVVLQNIDTLIWNITIVTSSFNMVNIRINAKNGKVISDNATSLLSFKNE